jgi:xanthine dehydrogenase accessory factor
MTDGPDDRDTNTTTDTDTNAGAGTAMDADAGWSRSESEVLSSARALLDEGRHGVLATVIDVEGSAYRRPGAKMLVPADGAGGIGHITAGCLEDEVERLAAEVLEAGEPRVERYDLMPEADDDVWGLGVGCNGIVDVLLEPIDEGYRPVLDAFAGGEDVGVLTVVPAPTGEGDAAASGTEEGTTPPVGARAYYDPSTGTFELGEAFPASLAERLRDAVATLTDRGRADTLRVDGTSVLVDGIAAPDDLLVVGTGNDVRPIVELGSRVGFQVTVVGFRGAAARADRFPAADEVVSTSPARMRDAVEIDAETAVVVATHNFVDDRLAIDELLASPAQYVGLMGPRERFEEMLEEFETEGREFSPDELDRLYTPVGLDLGAGDPGGIATSILAEVLAVVNDREPRHLRDREGPIHERVEVETDGSGER